MSEGLAQCEEQIINCNMPDSDDGVVYENQDEEAVAMIEESPSDAGINCNRVDAQFSFSFVSWILGALITLRYIYLQ